MSRQSSATWFERAATTVLPVALGAGVFIVAFVHVHDVAVWAGQPGWAAWIISLTGEAMAIAGLAAITSRRRANAPIKWAVFVVIGAVVFSGACNLTAVLHRAQPGDPADLVLHGKPGMWVGLMAVWPVIAFGLVAGLKATKPAHPDEPDETPADSSPRTSPARAAAARLAYAGGELADNIMDPKGYGRLYRDGGTALAAGHTPAATATFPPVGVGANGASGHVGVVAPVAAPWTRTGLHGGDAPTGGHNGEHADGHTGRSPLAPVDARPAPALAAPAAETTRQPVPVGGVTREAVGGQLWDVFVDENGRSHRELVGPDGDSAVSRRRIPTPPPTPVPPPREPVIDTPPVTVPPAPAPAPVSRERVDSTGPRPAAIEFRAPEPPAAAAPMEGGGSQEPDVSDLLDDGRTIRDALAAAGTALNRSTLHTGLKERGHRAGTRRLDALLRELRAEPVGAGR